MRTTNEHTASGRTDIAELARLIGRHAPYDGLFPLSVPGIDVYRSSRVATGVTHALQQAAVCMLPVTSAAPSRDSHRRTSPTT